MLLLEDDLLETVCNELNFWLKGFELNVTPAYIKRLVEDDIITVDTIIAISDNAFEEVNAPGMAVAYYLRHLSSL